MTTKRRVSGGLWRSKGVTADEIIRSREFGAESDAGTKVRPVSLALSGRNPPRLGGHSMVPSDVVTPRNGIRSAGMENPPVL